MVVAHPGTSFQYVREWDDDFLALFPHRYDYIWSRRPPVGQKPDWNTESRYPISDRLIRQGKYLYGVRFGQRTNYLLIDIDAGSRYHPSQDLLALRLLLTHLEVLGLVTHVACSSSYSGGIHLYFPFEEAQNSYQLAAAVAGVLESAGFTVAPGQLEIFPNLKLYASDGQPTLFNAHRLPLQEPGSYLLNLDWQPIYTTQSEFVRQWQFAQSRNTLNSETLSQVLKTHQPKRRRISNRANKFLADLDAEIEVGWTGPGQTNHILGRIAMRTYIFHHVLHGGFPLQDQPLVEAIASVARSLPGFSEWCRHQHELEKKAAEWARSVEASDYYPYGYGDQKPQQKSASSWNQQQQEAARERIRKAIAELLNKDQLPTNITARRKALVQYGISHSTLSKYKDLWHPHFLTQAAVALSEDELHPGSAISTDGCSLECLSEKELQPDNSNKLGDAPAADAVPQQSAAASFEVGGSGGFSTGGSSSDSQPTSELESIGASSSMNDKPGPSLIREILRTIAKRSRHSKQSTRSVQSPPDENYFRQLRQPTGDVSPNHAQEEFIQQSLELPEPP